MQIRGKDTRKTKDKKRIKSKYTDISLKTKQISCKFLCPQIKIS